MISNHSIFTSRPANGKALNTPANPIIPAIVNEQPGHPVTKIPRNEPIAHQADCFHLAIFNFLYL
jgi:hypothetical protein